jgi:formylglycine-generating enzyme required for sulfatase activity
VDSKETNDMNRATSIALPLLLAHALVTTPFQAAAQGIDVTPSTWDYGVVEVGDSSTQDIRLTSTAPQPLTIFDVTIVDDASGSFSITSNAPPPSVTLWPGQFIDVTVEFRPTGTGALTARVRIDSDAEPPTHLFFAPLQGWGDAAQAVDIDWVTVGDPGNACETQTQGCFGAVADTYRISRYETTNAQYAVFLNAVAATDSNDLYNTEMGSGFGGITRDGSPGSYTYAAIPGREQMPVGFISFYDALRFANWLHNGQPTGAQDATTTENGAYDMSLGVDVDRKPGARVFLTSEDEWYKAAYFNGTVYFDYPAGTSTETGCVVPSATANTANCWGAVGDFTAVGSYTGSPSPYGTFDQGGNAWEWNEARSSSTRGLRSGRFADGVGFLRASYRGFEGPTIERLAFGFRVASLPAPQVPSLGLASRLVMASLLVASGLLAQACRRRS